MPRQAKPRRSDGGGDAGKRAEVGLALAGGGPLGGIYEMGALLALSESLDGIDLNDVEVYGVSSGAFIAAGLANGISAAQMYRLFIDDESDATLSPALFLRPALREFARRALSVPRLFVRGSTNYLAHPRERGLRESVASLGVRRADRPLRSARHRCVSDPAVCHWRTGRGCRALAVRESAGTFLADPHRSLDAALTDPRPLFTKAPRLRHAARELVHTLDQLELWLATC